MRCGGGLRLQNAPMLLETWRSFPGDHDRRRHPELARGRTKRCRSRCTSQRLDRPLGLGARILSAAARAYANTLLKTACSSAATTADPPDRWMKDFDEAGVQGQVSRDPQENAKRLLGLT